MPYPRQITPWLCSEVDKLRKKNKSYREIGETLGVSHNTVWKALKMRRQDARMTNPIHSLDPKEVETFLLEEKDLIDRRGFRSYEQLCDDVKLLKVKDPGRIVDGFIAAGRFVFVMEEGGRRFYTVV